MRVWYLCAGVCLLYGYVGCEMIANNTMRITYVTPLGDGLWRASATCNTNFPSKTYGAHGAWMVTRIGVPFTNYKDFLAGQSIQTDPDGRWVISGIGYASGGGSLSYGLEFDYDLWLGAEVPTGDCHQFTDQLEAETFANNSPGPSDTPADTLIAVANFQLDYSTSLSSQGRCFLIYSGILFGAREAMILVNFTVPVQYLGDFFGNTILHEDTDYSTWYIVSDTFARTNAASYIMTFKFSTSNEDISSASCSMYVSETDAVAAALSTGAVATGAPSTARVTTARPPATVSGSRSTDTATVSVPGSSNTATVSVPGSTDPATVSVSGSSNTATVSVPGSSSFVTATVPRSSNTVSGNLVELREMRNQYVYDNCLWKKAVVNLVQCGRLCVADGKCVSVFYHKDDATCTGHRVVYGRGNAGSGVSYYVLS